MINREMTVNYLLQVVKRRKWTVAIPAIIFTVAAIVIGLSIPKVYQSDTVILVEPLQYVQNNAAGKPSIITSMESDGLSTLSQQILSRSHLEKIISEYSIYETFPMEQRVRSMREDIQLDVAKVDHTGNVKGFKISYQHQNPQISADVTNKLASLFIDENTTSREKFLDERSQFLNDQGSKSKLRLDELEQSLQKFKQANFEKLPEQREKNLKLMEQFNVRFSENSNALNRAQQQKIYLESMLAQYKSAPKIVREHSRSVAATAEPPIPKESKIVEKQFEETKAQLADLRNKYTENHPDVIRTTKRVGELEKKHEELKRKEFEQEKKQAEQEVAKSAKRLEEAKKASELEQKRAMGGGDNNKPQNSDSVSPETFVTLAQLNSQLRSIDSEIQERTAEQSRLRSQLNVYQSRLELPPALAQEFDSLSRDYNSAKENYDAIANEKNSTNMSQELELKQKTMLFRVLDPAKKPEKPIKPNRRAIALLGLLAGLGAGLGLAFLREFNDESIHNVREAEAAIGIEVLASIPQV